ncbi:MAG TPA: M90 family metallopeptidase [Gemmatimonadaceae bacterium]|nr:M90 family metallopeptidase [Gemmatimonadaceae bacterium]
MAGLLRNRRRRRLRATPLPDAWRAILAANVPLHARLPEDRRRELEGHIQVLLDEKHFEGSAGLEITDEIRVTIAAHAALLLLGGEPSYYPGLETILVYPSAYVAPVEEHEPGGIVTEGEEERLGESWGSGVVVLAWDEALHGARDARDGENVILHEFAHQLDEEDGTSDGTPYLQSRGRYRAWARVLGAELAALRADPGRGVLDSYGAENPAEFFAVATEAFFETPEALRLRHPELYAELSALYGLDLAR